MSVIFNLLNKIKDIFFSRSSRKKNIFTIIAILTTAAILGWLLYSNKDVLTSYTWKLNFKFLFISFLVYSLILLLTVYVWANIMEKLGKNIPFPRHFKSFCISALGKRLPGTVWYIAWRAEMYKDDYSIKLVTIASGIEMAVTIIAAIIVCVFFSLSIITQYQWSIWAILFLLILSMVVLHPKFVNWLFSKIKIEIKTIAYRNILVWVALYAIIWIFVGTLLFTISNIITPGDIMQLPYYIGITALTGVLSRLLFFSPTNFGFNEVSLSLLLSNVIPSSLAVIVAVSNRLIIMTFEILWAVFSLLVERNSKINK
jgi:uncharacterized membrane protein YbhN (UPF0104 family)